MKQFLLLLCLATVGFTNAQTDTTSSGDYFLTFVKKVYLNPTVYLRCQEFKETTNIGFVALPDLSSSQNNASSGFEKGLQKLLRLLMQTDGGIRFYFTPDTPTAPFTFWHSDNLWCKFKQPEKDSITYYLNHNFSDGNLDLNNNQRFESTVDETLDYIQRVLARNTASCGSEPQNETTTINTKPLAINLHNTAGSKYDIDYKLHPELASNYASATDLFTQQDWYAPSKMFVAGGGIEPVVMSINLHDPQFKKENLKIEVLKTHSVLQFTYSNDSVRFNLPENLIPSDPMEIVVKYKSQVDSINYTVGFFMVNVVEEQQPKVVLLGANGHVVSNTDVTNIQDYLNKVYKPAGVTFEVSSDPYVFPGDYPLLIQDEGSGLLSNYPADLHDYVGDIKDLEDYDSEIYYLVLGLNSSNSDLLGYMPRARNIGFIFFPESGSITYKVETVAHELGHGAFHFRHIFAEEELGENALGSTENIMDYANVSIQEALYLHQWNFIKDPAFVSWGAGDDEDANSNVGPINHIPAYLLNSDKKTISFVTPGGSVVSFEVAKLDKFYFQLFSDTITKIAVPIGVLKSFTYDDTAYYSKIDYYPNSPLKYTFHGYYNSNGTYFKDRTRTGLNDTASKTASMLVYREGRFDYVKFDIGNLSIPVYNYVSQSKTFNNLQEFPFKPFNTIQKNESGYVKDFNDIVGFDYDERVRANNLEYLTANHLQGTSKESGHYLILAQIIDIASFDDELFHYYTSIGKFNQWEEEGYIESGFEGIMEISSGVDLNSNWDENVEGNVGGLYTKFKNNPWGLYQEDFIPGYLVFRKNILDNLHLFWDDFSTAKFQQFSGSSEEVGRKRDMYLCLLRMATTLATSSFLENDLESSQKIDAVQVLMSTNDYFTGAYETCLVKLLKCVKSPDANYFLDNLEKRKTIARAEREPRNLTAFIFDNVHNVGIGEQYTEVTLELIRISLLSSTRREEYQDRFIESNFDFAKLTVPFYYTGFWREAWHSINPYSAPSFDTESEVLVDGTTGKCRVSFQSYKYRLGNVFSPVFIPSGENIPELISQKVELNAFDLINVENNSEDITFAMLMNDKDSIVLVPAFAIRYMDDEGFSKSVCDGIDALIDVLSIATGVGAVFSTLSKARKAIALIDAIGGGLSIANSANNSQNETLAAINNAVSLLNLGFGAVDFVKSFRTASSAVDATATMMSKIDNPAQMPTPSNIFDFANYVEMEMDVIRASNDINGKLTLYMLFTRFEDDYKIAKKTDAAYQKILELKRRLGNNWKNILNDVPLSGFFDLSVVAEQYQRTVDAFSGIAEMVAHQLKIGNQVIGEFTGGVLNLVTETANASVSTVKYFLKKVSFGSFTDVPIFIAKKLDGTYVCIREGACFTPETQVLTRNGYLQIQQIQLGDSVLSYNENSHTMEYAKVTNAFSKFTNKLQRIVVGTDTIWTTPDHLFKTVFNDWVPAKNLVAGMLLLLANDSLAVQSNLEKDSTLAVYNLEIEGTHTYTVGSGNIIVHNDCEWFKQLNLSGEYMEKLRKLKLADPDFVIRMKTVFGESSESVEKFLKFLDDNPALATKLKDKTLSITAWHALSKSPHLQNNLDALTKMTALKNKGLSATQLTNIGDLGNSNLIDIAHILVNRVNPTVPINQLDLICINAKALSASRSTFIEELKTICAMPNLKNPDGLHRFVQNAVDNPSATGWQYELDILMQKLNSGAPIEFSKVVSGKEIDILDYTIGNTSIIELKSYSSISWVTIAKNLGSDVGAQFNKIDNTLKSQFTSLIGQVRIEAAANSIWLNATKEVLIQNIKQARLQYPEIITKMDNMTHIIIENATGTHVIEKSLWQ